MPQTAKNESAGCMKTVVCRPKSPVVAFISNIAISVSPQFDVTLYSVHKNILKDKNLCQFRKFLSILHNAFHIKFVQALLALWAIYIFGTDSWQWCWQVIVPKAKTRPRQRMCRLMSFLWSSRYSCTSVRKFVADEAFKHKKKH